MNKMPYHGSETAINAVKIARGMLFSVQTELLKSSGWTSHRHPYSGAVRWSHPDVLDGLHVTRGNAIDLAMDELEVDQ